MPTAKWILDAREAKKRKKQVETAMATDPKYGRSYRKALARSRAAVARRRGHGRQK